MQLKDAEGVASLATELGYQSTPSEVVARMETVLKDAQQGAWVAVKNEHIIGWVHVAVRQTLTAATHAEVVALVVSNANRREGIGATLMAETEKWAREKGLGLLRLRSRNDRTEAHRFYERIGYRHDTTSLTFVRKV